ncbi:LysE/ArgO family amino acid transporter [Nocardiopsis dassonvillei]|uniref:LysE/ArgO family amino acid transporter n=1 Tax=Nocardiopsis dassonvillei TaxID=2014 RepID=UPI0020108FF0|nr:LysE/ArgO family amino acid transporter [Nocardiopsis dassonvillei]MCK9869199.1 LysE/ArgO family amino acid transporter [Nocardiopsis dassonvillei]
MNETLLPALLGLGTGLALIVAIGAQNAHVLRVGIEGRTGTVLPVVLVCALSDAVLITAGVLGVGVVVEAAPLAVTAVRLLGAGFLVVYGLSAARRVLRPGSLVVGGGPSAGRGAAVTTALVLTWLNPHVYLDTVVFLGSLANQQGGDARWWWTAGAVTGSFVWFFGLGFGARLLRPVFARPGAWRVLDALIAAVMLTLGVRMALGA